MRVAATSCSDNLVIKESGNNVKIVVLDRLDVLPTKHEHKLGDLFIDVFQVPSKSVSCKSIL